MSIGDTYSWTPVAFEGSSGIKCCGDKVSVLHGLQKARENPDGKSSYATVWTEWSDEEYQAYFGKEAKTS